MSACRSCASAELEAARPRRTVSLWWAAALALGGAWLAAPATAQGQIPAGQDVFSNVRPAGPLVIRRGGTYSGHWESTDADEAAVTVDTTEPVVIRQCRLAGRGHLIHVPKVGANVTITDCRATGLAPRRKGTPPGRFVNAVGPDRLIVENNELTSTAGIYVDGLGAASTTVSIQRNRARNIEGRLSDGNGGFSSASVPVQFVQLNNLRAAPDVRIAWNEVVNEPGRSRVEDVISIHSSSGLELRPIRIAHNFILGASPARPDIDAFSGGGIIVDGISHGPSKPTGHVAITDNQVLATLNHGIAVAAGVGVTVSGNTLISTGLLSDGRTARSANIGLYVWDVYGERSRGMPLRNHRVSGNRVAWWNQHGVRNDAWFPDCQFSTCEGNESLQIERHNDAYRVEQAAWKAKLASSAVTLGPR